MDFLILTVACANFIVFVLTHCLVLLILKEKRARGVDVWLLLVGLTLTIVQLQWHSAAVIFLTCLIYTLAVWLYLLVIRDALINSSLRLNILVYIHSLNGQLVDEIYKRYDSKAILDVYLARLQQAGLIRCHHQMYSIEQSKRQLFLLGSIQKNILHLFKILEK